MSAGFHLLTVTEVRPETADAITVTLQPSPEAHHLFRFSPGQHLTLRADIDGEDVRRNYSICASPSEGGLRVAIKSVEGGVFSNWAVEAFKPGLTVEAMAPHGSFTWTFDPARRGDYAAFAGGSGVTPILSLLKTGLEVEARSRFVLLYGNRTSGSIMFLEELAALKDRYLGRLQVYHFLTQESDDVDLFNGRIDAEKLERTLASLIDPNGLDAAFVCGPAPLMEAVEIALVKAGVDPARVLAERFTAGRPSAAESEAAAALQRRAEGVRLEVIVEGRRRRVTFEAKVGNILEAARAAGAPAPFACKAGVCATCRAKVLAGQVEMKVNYGLSAEELAQGYVLTCQAVPLGSGVVIDYDA